MTFDSLDESFNLDGDIGLGKVLVGVAIGHGCVPGWLFAYQIRAVYFLTDDLFPGLGSLGCVGSS
ncbi:hypothetical protein D9M68_641890 [compost metagenome]